MYLILDGRNPSILLQESDPKTVKVHTASKSSIPECSVVTSTRCTILVGGCRVYFWLLFALLVDLMGCWVWRIRTLSRVHSLCTLGCMGVLVVCTTHRGYRFWLGIGIPILHSCSTLLLYLALAVVSPRSIQPYAMPPLSSYTFL